MPETRPAVPHPGPDAGPAAGRDADARAGDPSGRAPLGRLLVVTDRRQARHGLLATLRRAVDGGLRAVLLREKDLPRGERVRLAAAIRALLAPVGGALLVASDPTIPADGLHLAANDPSPGPGRRPVPVGRSCHHRQEVVAAREEGCTYVTLSPVFPSPSKPGHGPALGLGALGGHPLPVYALGGVDAEGAAACVDAGAAGVAVMGAVMRADRPERVTARLLGALGEPA